MLLQILLISNFAFSQSYDFYRSEKAKAPILILVHGGAWQSGSKEDFKPLATKLSKQGVCVAVAEYRQSNVAKHPAPIDDLQKVLKDLKADGCDSKRIYLAGHSAGAHLIAFWNTKFTDERIKGLIGIEGIYDIAKLVKDWPTYREWFIDKEFGSNHWNEASPTLLKPRNSLPWLVVHSKADELVNTQQSVEFVASLRKQKVKVDYFESSTGSHFDLIKNLDTNEAGRKVLEFMHVARVPES